METATKIQAFHYVVKVLSDYKKLEVLYNGGVVLSKLVSQKMLFFVCTYGDDLFDVFDDFWALPYGPVEKDILSYLNGFTISELAKDKIVNTKLYDSLDQGIKVKIDNAVDKMYRHEFFLYLYNELAVTEKSHLYPSWYKTYSIAQANGKQAQKIDRELLLNDIAI